MVIFDLSDMFTSTYLRIEIPQAVHLVTHTACVFVAFGHFCLSKTFFSTPLKLPHNSYKQRTSTSTLLHIDYFCGTAKEVIVFVTVGLLAYLTATVFKKLLAC